MVTLEKLDEDTQHLVGQTATQVDNLKSLLESLLKLQSDLKHDDVKSAEHDVEGAISQIKSAIGRTEKYEEREGEVVAKGMEELAEHIPGKFLSQLKKTQHDLRTFLDYFIAQLGRGDSHFRQQFNALHAGVEALEQNDSEEARLALVKQAAELAQHVEKVQEMLNGLNTELQDYEKLITYLTSLLDE